MKISSSPAAPFRHLQRLTDNVNLAGARDLGVRYSHQVTDLPEARAETVQHDRHEVECACGQVHVAGPPPEAGGAPGTVTYGLNLQAWCVFLMVMHHVPVERCADILGSMSGTRPSDGWVHALLARAATAVAAANKTIRALIILARVVCGDETPIRSGPGPKTKKRYLQVACTSLLTYYFLGSRDLPSFKDFIYSDLHGTVIVHDRYVNYDHFTGVSHQLCTAHLLRDVEDAVQSYPDAIWPGQIAEALRGLIHAANLSRDQGLAAVPGEMTAEHPTLFRRGVTVGLSQAPPRPGCQDQAAASPAPAGMPALPRSRRAAVSHRHRHPPDQQPGRTRPAALQDPAEDQRPAPLGEDHPGPVRHPRIRLHRRQARDRRLHRHPRRTRRKPVDTTHLRNRLNYVRNQSHNAAHR